MFAHEHLVDSAFSALDPVIAVSQVFLQEPITQVLQALGLGNGDQVVTRTYPTSPSTPPFFVGASRVAKAGSEVVVGMELDKFVLLHASFASKDLLDRSGEIVVDQNGYESWSGTMAPVWNWRNLKALFSLPGTARSREALI